MALITLTMKALSDECDLGWKVDVNTENIQYFYRPYDARGTKLVMTANAIIVEETPEKIRELIFTAEHPECKL